MAEQRIQETGAHDVSTLEGTEPVSRVLVTMGSVRRTPEKQSFPLDTVTALGNAQRRMQFFMESGGAAAGVDMEHTHLIGDASRVWSQAAGASGSFAETVRLVRNSVLNGRHRMPLEDELEPVTARRVEIVDAIGRVFGRKINAVSALQFLRDSREVARQVVETLERLGGLLDESDPFDVNTVRREMDPSDTSISQREVLLRWRDAITATLPPNLYPADSKDKVAVEEAVLRGFYGVAEAAIADAVVNELGGVYASYRGSFASNEKDLITDSMRLLVAALACKFVNPERAHALGQRFWVDSALDGIGYTETETGELKGVVDTDPYLQYWPSDPRKPRKVPFIMYENGVFRPTTSQEVRDAVRDPKTQGIAGTKEQIWSRNVGPFADFLVRTDDGAHGSLAQNTELTKLLLRTGVSSEALKDWLGGPVASRLGRVARGGRDHKLTQLFPFGAVDGIGFVSDTVALMAKEVLAEVKRAKSHAVGV